jgi:cell wall-associated NlpC family hydrolase
LNRCWLLIVTIAGVCLSGCASTLPRPVTPTPPADRQAPAGNLETLFRSEAASWAGTPHVLGGTTRRGLDCSAFVRTVYDDVLGLPLPRTTIEQSRLGAPVAASQLQTGDLVFYRIDPFTRHVGIYLGNDEFMHASKSEGVTISTMQTEYWQKRFWTVRRILDTVPPLSGAMNPEEDTDKTRISW